MRYSVGKFIEVQSSRNCASTEFEGLRRIAQFGCTLEVVFISSGKILCLTSAVALHATSTCSADSTVANQLHIQVVHF